MSQPKGIPSKAAMFHHALHPILVDFPIAFWIGGALTDVAYWLNGQEDVFWARASAWLIGLGVLMGIAAAVMGIIDFFTVVPPKAKRAGWIHFILNTIALTLSLLNILLRLGDEPGQYIVYFGLILSLFTALLITIGGWFGGELVMRHGISVFGDRDKD
ncbi:MAG: DUF2231 domain-containing protein [Chloroflexi bacterium]|nr:DUF2231 domain-containing protein [Chloroflexota bacterium]MBP8055848.1 DUF2231 domain-containing protein [Chloroflexota bacterium]